MVKKNGVYLVKTAQERDLEKRVRDRKRELLESYRAQKEERGRETSTHILNTETQSSVERAEERINTSERRRREERESDAMEERVSVRQRSNGLRSTPAPEREPCSEPPPDREVKRTPSFRLNAGKLHEKLSWNIVSTSRCHVSGK